jgi:predicted transposase YbfD/YdcC
MLWDYFKELSEPRVDRTKLHSLEDIVIICICAIICGCEGWEHIEDWAKDTEEWLSKFLSLSNGIPSHDTLRRVFTVLDPKEFQSCFTEWTSSIRKKIKGEILSIDGKTLRRSHNHREEKKAAHIVSAWASENALVLGQVKVSEKTNEITAIPELLDKLCIEDCIVTTDAMGCQKKISEKIINQGGDYVLALKENHPNLYEDVKGYFETAELVQYTHVAHDYQKTLEKGHGRIEQREFWITEDIDWIEDKANWKGLKSIGVVKSKRTLGGKESCEYRYYLCSIKADALLFGEASRKHWHVENKLHWCLDVQLREDESRIRKGYSAENFAVLRHLALNLLKREKSFKKGLKAKQLKASRNHKYLEAVLEL